MSAQPQRMEFRWEDPQLAEKASAFFLADLRLNRENQAVAASAMATAPTEGSDTAANGNGNDWHLGLDNLPEELPAQKFLTLLKSRLDILSALGTPFPVTDDGRQAAREFMFRRILLAAHFFIYRLLFYLLFDNRFHPERKIRANAIRVLRIGNDEAEDECYYQEMKDLFVGMRLCNLLNRPAAPNGDLTNAITILRDCGDIFFMTLGSLFPLRAIGKCHMSFSMFMDALGVSTSTECVAKFVKHMKAMQRAIEDWDAHGGTVSSNASEMALDSQNPMIRQLCEDVRRLQADQQASANAIDRMDRRQRDLFKFIKSCLTGFTKLFRPEKPKPTREQVKGALLPPDRYACLAGIKEPHRSQVKAVIDYTYRHPIVFKQQKGEGYTLSDAVRDTWRENEAKWSLIPDTFPTVEHLRTACYNQQEGLKDPFCYQP